MNFKFTYLGLNISKLVWNSQITTGGTLPPITPPPFDNVADIDFAFSGLAYNEKIWGGFNIDHLLRPKTSFWGESTSVPIKVDLFGGFQIISRGRLKKKLRGSFVCCSQCDVPGRFLPVRHRCLLLQESPGV